MTFSKTATLGCLATLAMSVSLPGWGAERFSPGNQPLGSIAPIVLSNADLRGGNTKGYRPWFENGSWQGDLVEYTVTAEGNLSTSVEFDEESPTNASNGANWSALVNFAAKNQATYWDTGDPNDPNDTGRKIITVNSNTQLQAPFRFTDAGIGADNRQDLIAGDTAPTAEDTAANKLNFVRGDRSNEHPNGSLRRRTSILGDIIHSKPVYVGAPNDTRTEEGYGAWAADKSNRAPRVYVGANDGMMHVFDADTGEEVYAYVPSMLIGRLGLLTARPYSHTYYVDGEMSARDAYFNGAWHTVLAGSLGAGGKGFFALDITDPNLSRENASTGNDKKVLFEFDASTDDDLGDSFSRPVIAKLNDGKWYVIVGNGYNSVNGAATLYLVNLETNALTKLSTSSGTADNPNGLSSPSLLDADRNGTADYAYVGDIDGNLWKFDLSSSSAGNWDVAYNAKPLHPSVGNQAIIQAPQIARHPLYGYLVYFATGRLLTESDINDTSIQSLYGIWDSGNPLNDPDYPPDAYDPDDLLTQNWDGPKTYNYTDSDNEAATQTIAIYNDAAPPQEGAGTPDEEAGTPDWETRHGWKVNFPEGYRVLQPLQVRAGRVKATVHRPNENQQGENWLVEALLTDGGPNPLAAPIYNLNVDDQLNAADLYTDNAAAEDPEWHVPMMWRQVDGIMSQVTIGFLDSGIDTLFINFLQPSIANSTPCTENCTDGFFNGHIDVQTYPGSRPRGTSVLISNPPFRFSNAHLYDKLLGRVYVDYFDLRFPPPASSGFNHQFEIDSFGDYPPDIGESEEFIVLVANADLSPGGTLQIGTKTWNVLDYQIQLHKALLDWDPRIADALPRDDDGDSLVFKWGDIQDMVDGTIRVSFNDRAILDGGLHPTNSQCVVQNGVGGRAETYNTQTKEGRWRNGALTLQLVKKSYFNAQPVNPALAMVDIQKPQDLAPSITTDTGDVLITSIESPENEYKQIGGLLAQNDAEHLWESTLFWHYGDLVQFTDLITPGITSSIAASVPCYGEANWPAAVALEQDNDAITATLARLGENDVTAETLEAELEAELLASQGCTGTGCDARYKLLQAIFDLVDDYQPRPDDNDGNDDPDSDAPVVIDGGSTGAGLDGDGGDGSITQGNSHQPGRMSWTDVVK